MNALPQLEQTIKPKSIIVAPKSNIISFNPLSMKRKIGKPKASGVSAVTTLSEIEEIKNEF